MTDEAQIDGTTFAEKDSNNNISGIFDRLNSDLFHTVDPSSPSDVDTKLSNFDFVKIKDGASFGGSGTITYDPAEHGSVTIIDASASFINYTGTGDLFKTLDNQSGQDQVIWIGGVLDGNGASGTSVACKIEDTNRVTFAPAQVKNFSKHTVFAPQSAFSENCKIEGDGVDLGGGVEFDTSGTSGKTSFKGTEIDARIDLDGGVTDATGLITTSNTNLYDSTVDMGVLLNDSSHTGWDLNGDYDGTTAFFRAEKIGTAGGTGINRGTLNGGEPLLINPHFLNLGTDISGNNLPLIQTPRDSRNGEIIIEVDSSGSSNGLNIRDSGPSGTGTFGVGDGGDRIPAVTFDPGSPTNGVKRYYRSDLSPPEYRVIDENGTVKTIVSF